MKKINICLLITILIFGQIAVAYANNMEQDKAPNRYYYTYTTSSKELIQTITITQDEIKNTEAVQKKLMDAMSVFYFGSNYVISFTYSIAEDMYDMKGPGTVKIYRQKKIEWQVDRLDGSKRKTAEFWVVQVKLYEPSGNLHNSHTHEFRIK